MREGHRHFRWAADPSLFLGFACGRLGMTVFRETRHLPTHRLTSSRCFSLKGHGFNHAVTNSQDPFFRTVIPSGARDLQLHLLTPTFGQILPAWVLGFDQCESLGACPGFDLLFACDGVSYVLECF